MQHIDFTSSAKKQIANIFTNTNNNGLRILVTDTGCAGRSYNMDFGSLLEDDTVFKVNGVSIFIDKESLNFLDKTTIDYSGNSKEKGFIFDNPNAEKTCGCGGSFKEKEK